MTCTETLDNTAIGQTTPCAGNFTGITFTNTIDSVGTGGAWIFGNGYLAGWDSGNSGSDTSAYDLSSSDQLNFVGSFNYLNVTDAFGGFTAAGSRNLINGSFLFYGSPNPGTVSSAGGPQNNYVVNQNTISSGYPIDAFPINNWTAGGNLFGGDDDVTLSSGGLFWEGIVGREISVGLAGAKAYTKIGLHLTTAGGSENTVYGTWTDAAICFGNGPQPIGWQNILLIGSTASDPPTDATSTIIKIEPRQYGTAGAPGIVDMLWGFDFRSATIPSSGGFMAARGFGVDGNGNTGAASLNTTRAVQAQTAVLSGVTISAPGVYTGNTFPTFVCGSPPPGGTTATVKVTAMQVTDFIGFGVTGSGYAVNDVLTFAGVSGTPFTATVTSVDSHGGITGISITTNGSITNAASNPIYPTGGAGTGAAYKVLYTQSSANFLPSQVIPGTTGKSYQVSDTLTLAGDTGAAGEYSVASVDSHGGILSLTVSVAGNITAIASATYHSFMGGHGTGGSISVAYGVHSVSFTAGSGYVLQSPPRILSNFGGVFNAQLIASLSLSYQTLTLNPSGGDIQAGTGTALALSATTGFLRIPFMEGKPTAPPSNSVGPALVWNDSTKNLNIWSPAAAAWYHLAAVAGTG